MYLYFFQGFAPPQHYRAYAPVPNQPYGDVYGGGGNAGAPFGSGGPVVQPYGYNPGPAGPPQPFGYPPGPAGPQQPIITQPGMPPAQPHPGMGPGGPAGAFPSPPKNSSGA